MALSKPLSILALLGGVSADLPVHCLRHQIEGEWEFTLSPTSSVRSSCGHAKPDDQNLEPKLYQLDGPTETMKVHLESPDRATSDTDYSGTFTMIYDEGFEVAVDNKVFFAFSRFDLVDGGEMGPKNVTHCGETLTGWYREKNQNKFGCYFGKKKMISSDAPELTNLNAFYSQTSKSFAFDTPLSEDWHQKIVDRLNARNDIAGTLLQRSTWTAKVYSNFVDKTPRDLNKMAGLKRTMKIDDAHKNQHRHRKDDKKPFSFLQQSKDRFQAPESWDWQEEGVLDDVVNQGDCGSCYTVSTIRMLSARNRIRQRNKELPPFSISFPLHCAEYNQGCDGGYAFLQSKWSEDVGLVPATCFPYNTQGKCTDVMNKDCVRNSNYKAKNHRYVGGYYGGGDEEEIKKELLNNGPVVISFEPKDDFMYYHNGIYKSSEEQIHQEWERVDHAVLLVGYGTTSDGQKYWKVQNSWGQDWGEDGYFKIARGDNDSGVESIAVAADVEMGDNNAASFLDTLV